MFASKISRMLVGALMMMVCLGSSICHARQAQWQEPVQFEHVSLSSAESALTAAIQAESRGCDQCVDLYFQAASSALSNGQFQLINTGRMCGRAAQIYSYALEKLVTTGQQFGRLDARNGLQVYANGVPQFVPAVHTGFVRSANEFDLLIPKSSNGSKKIERNYRCNGLGISTVVQHCRDRSEVFRRERQLFAATVVLRPENQTGQFVLELIDPLRVRTTNVNGQQVSIVRDISAPVAYVLETRSDNVLEWFLYPGGSEVESQLFMIEPYQQGKIPLIFVHGLLSDPFTWADMANEIMARPEIFDRYQIWGFEYATGEPFLDSAADLRDQLQQIRATFDPNGTDPGFDQTVLVGHSMGGLISKLQITQSCDQLWQSVSNCPLTNIATSEFTRGRLARSFYFGPSNSIAKVVYMGTPHRGSPWAKRTVGRLGAKLVEEPSSMKKQHEQLIRDNPGNFSREFQRRIPTSVDLLRPDSPLLLAMDCLEVAPHVEEHSIIGTYRPMLGSGDSDGVVPVSSAQRPTAQTETLVRSRHTNIPHKQDTVTELVRILVEHATQTSPAW